ncbi:MAG: hypothetical protein RMJ98_16520 [Myxococcales bacterium]|nr:hypothetical protein [Polyangiaceae bacterium]MDW8250900.1 hypothetical protein [Myxococcales bacterium]
MGILGIDMGGGQDRGAARGASQGAQVGLRVPLVTGDGRFRLDALVGGRPHQGTMGELRFQSDLIAGAPARGTWVVWGWWGMDLAVLRTPTVWHSLLELPRAHLGFRSLYNEQGFELGGRLGYTLLGRYNPEGASRSLGHSITPAIYSLLYTRSTFLSWDVRAISPLRGQGRPVWTSEGLLCGVQGKFAFCVTGRHFYGQVRPNDGRSEGLASSWQLGFLLGLGERIGSSSPN